MSSTIQPTKQKISSVDENLKILLANSYILYVKTQNFHWNVTGPRFQQLHNFFEEQYTLLADAIDLIAEQIRSHNERPPSSLQEFLGLSTLQESHGTLSENEMLSALLYDHESIQKQLTDSISEAQDANDEATADLLVERLREHDKIAWMIRSHL